MKLRSFSIGPFHFVGDDGGIRTVKKMGSFKAVTKEELIKAGFSEESIERFYPFKIEKIPNSPKNEEAGKQHSGT